MMNGKTQTSHWQIEVRWGTHKVVIAIAWLLQLPILAATLRKYALVAVGVLELGVVWYIVGSLPSMQQKVNAALPNKNLL